MGKLFGYMFMLMVVTYSFFNLSATNMWPMFGLLFVAWIVSEMINLVLKHFFAKPAYKGKILDSSALVDGRLIDLMKLNFIDGPFIVPNFILGELHRLADSENPLKRAKGRRALDFVNEIKDINVVLKFDKRDFERISDVDTKLMELALKRNCRIITTDYNLTKVAEIKGIEVVNINMIANVLKTVFLPNEEIVVTLVRKGDKDEQAVGYLEDGTMVVVEDGEPALGKETRVVVTSMYPTPAGKIIFAKLK